MSNQRGFTLSELLVATAVLGLVMGGLLTLYRQGQSAYLIGAARAEVQQNARHGLEFFMNELRTAKAITAVGAGCSTGPDPTGGGTTTISFTDQNDAALVYALVGTDLQRNGEPVVGGVEMLRIWCFGVLGEPTEFIPNVRSLRVLISTETEQAVAAYHDRNQHARFDTRVRLRNQP